VCKQWLNNRRTSIDILTTFYILLRQDRNRNRTPFWFWIRPNLYLQNCVSVAAFLISVFGTRTHHARYNFTVLAYPNRGAGCPSSPHPAGQSRTGFVQNNCSFPSPASRHSPFLRGRIGERARDSRLGSPAERRRGRGTGGGSAGEAPQLGGRQDQLLAWWCTAPASLPGGSARGPHAVIKKDIV
jgi:hypothetical protein